MLNMLSHLHEMIEHIMLASKYLYINIEMILLTVEMEITLYFISLLCCLTECLKKRELTESI